MNTQQVRHRLLGRILCCERGVTSIEYALIASIISMAILLGATSIGGSLSTTFSEVADNLT